MRGCFAAESIRLVRTIPLTRNPRTRVFRPLHASGERCFPRCPNSRQAAKSRSDGVMEVGSMSEGRRARPQPTPETQHFWDGTREGELRLQRCNACGKVYFPPRPFCPACAARDVAMFAATGKGRLYSYVIHHRPVPGFTPPYAIAVVELEEGPRLMTNITGCPQTPEALQLDMPVEIAFEKLDDEITLPLFRPARNHPRHVADPTACRRGAQCDGRCRAQTRRH